MKLPISNPGVDERREPAAADGWWAGVSQRVAAVPWSAYAWLLVPLAVFVVSRLVVFAAAVIGDVLLPTDPGHWDPAPGQPITGLWARWDSQWYEWIITEGYWLRPGQRSNVAFFPLYPLLVKGLMPLVGGSFVVAGLIVSHVSFLLGLVFLYKLTELELADAKAAARAIFYFAIFPTAFFFSMVYTESLFVMLLIGSVYFGRKHLWAWAALLGLLATATRVIGVLVWGVLMWEWLRLHGWTLETMFQRQSWANLWRGLRTDWLSLFLISLIPLGLLSYMAFLQANFGDALAFLSVQSSWGRSSAGLVAVVAENLRLLVTDGLTSGNIARLLNLLTVAAVVGLTPVVWRRLGAGYALFMLLAVLIPLNSSTQSIIRYVLAAFPLFILAGAWGRHALFDRVYTPLAAALLAVLTTAFVNWFFVA